MSDFPKRNTLCCHRGLQGFSLSFDKERTIQKLYDKTQIVQKLRWLHVVSGFVGDEGIVHFLQEYQKEQETAYLFITHNKVLAKTICDEIYEIREGICTKKEM